MRSREAPRIVMMAMLLVVLGRSHRRIGGTLQTMTPAELLRFVHGSTFDDILFCPQYSVVARRDPTRLDLSSRLSTNLTLRRPIVSANMDTVTWAPMAIVQAEEGGLGVIDRGFRPGEI